MRKIVIATRGSALALAQTKLVAAHLKAAKPGLRIELKVVTSTGDTITHVPLAAIGGAGSIHEGTRAMDATRILRAASRAASSPIIFTKLLTVDELVNVIASALPVKIASTTSVEISFSGRVSYNETSSTCAPAAASWRGSVSLADAARGRRIRLPRRSSTLRSSATISSAI